MNVLNIVGAAPADGRNKTDFYPTPPEVTTALLRFLRLPPATTVWEPACGDGRMAEVMREHHLAVIATDIAQGYDFLKMSDRSEDWIITNPPFSYAAEFIEQCISFDKPFALLLKAQFWHSKKRLPLFEKCPPDYICPLTWRPDFTGKGASMMDVMWCIWVHPRTGTTIYRPLCKPEAGEERI